MVQRQRLGQRAVVLALVLLLAVPFTVAGAGAQEEEPDEIEIEVWFGREGFVPSDEFETFHEENPNIRVNYTVVPLEEAHEAYLRQREVGEAPDVVQIFSEFIPTLVARDAVEDISGHLREWEQEDPEDFNDLFDVAFDSLTFDGETYGINVATHPFFLAYRSDWVGEAGFDPPETWNDVLEISRALQDEMLTGEQYAYAHPGGTHHPPRWMSGTMASFGVEFTDSGLPLLTSTGGVALIEFYQTLAEEGLAHPENHTWASGDHRGAFMGSRAAFVPEQVHTLSVFEAEGLAYPGEFDAMPFPYLEGNEDNYRVATFGCPMMVSDQVEYSEAVAEVLRYIASYENVLDVAMKYSPMARESVMTSDEYLGDNPYYEAVAQAFEQQEVLPGHPRAMEVNDILNDMKVTAQTELDRSPADIAEEYQARLNELD